MELLAIPGGVSANFALEVTEIHSTLKRDFEGNLDTVNQVQDDDYCIVC